MSVKRPNAVLCVWYAVGGKLPDRYREWVLHDATVPSWLIRHVVRRLTFMLPILVLLFVFFVVILGYDTTIVLLALALGIYAGVYYSLIFSTHSVDSRVTRHGYPDEYASQVRKALKEAEHQARTNRFESRWRENGDK